MSPNKNPTSILSNFSVKQKGMLLVLVPVIFELVFVVMLFNVLSHAAARQMRIHRSREMILFLTRALKEGGDSAYVILNGSPVIDAAFNAELQRTELIGKKFEGYSARGDIDPALTRLLPKIHELGVDMRSSAIKLRHALEDKSIPPARRADLYRFEAIRQFQFCREIWAEVVSAELSVARQAKTQVHLFVRQLVVALLLGVGLNCCVCLLLMHEISTDYFVRLRKAREYAENVLFGDQKAGLSWGADEIGEISTTLLNAAQEVNLARRRERAVIDNAQELVFTLNRELEFLTANQQSTKFFSANICSPGLSITSCVDPEELPSFQLAFQKIVATGKGSVTSRFSVAPKDRTLDLSVVYSARNALFYCSAQDVSAEAEYLHLQTTLVAMLSHDLKQPLQTVLNSLIEMEDRASNTVLKCECVSAQTELHSLLAQIQQFLSLVRVVNNVRSGQKLFSLYDTLQSVIEKAEKTMAASGLQIEEPFGDAAIIADERQIQNILEAIIRLLSVGCNSPTSLRIFVQQKTPDAVINIPEVLPNFELRHYELEWSLIEIACAINNISLVKPTPGVESSLALIIPAGAE